MFLWYQSTLRWRAATASRVADAAGWRRGKLPKGSGQFTPKAESADLSSVLSTRLPAARSAPAAAASVGPRQLRRTHHCRKRALSWPGRPHRSRLMPGARHLTRAPCRAGSGGRRPVRWGGLCGGLGWHGLGPSGDLRLAARSSSALDGCRWWF